MSQHASVVNRDLIVPYAIPYFGYVGLVSIGPKFISDLSIYVLCLMIVPLLLFWAWKWYAPLSGPKSMAGSVLWGIIFGLLGLVLWCALLQPFVDIKGEAWEFNPFLARALAASLIVPVFEEMFIRGYFLKAAWQWDMNRKNPAVESALNHTLDEDSVNDVPPGAWSVAAIVISSIAFAAGHMPSEWLAAVAYSLLISFLWVLRKDLLSCMVAHGVTNLSLSIYVWYSGNWGFW